jgi:hypothetical protein
MNRAIVKPLTKSEARTLTDTINSAAENMGELLLSAHDGRAWAALGYKSWREYAVAEFKFAQSRVYQLLSFEYVKRALEENSTIVEKPTHESQARPLARLQPAKQREAWDKAVETSATGKPTAKEVAAAVETVTPSRTERITYTPSNAFQYVQMAIDNLEAIQPNDTQRQAGFDRLIRWIEEHR